MKTLPKSIVIGPLTYKIEEISDLYHKGTAIFGFFNPTNVVIQIEKDIPGQRRLITLWHEILHAILNHADRGDVDDNVISTLGFGVVQVLQANPFLGDGHYQETK